MNQEQYELEQDYLGNQEEWEAQEGDYLTMARIMNRERTKCIEEHTEFRNYTGFEQIIFKTAYNAGFMAGFSGRYFGEDN